MSGGSSAISEPLTDPSPLLVAIAKLRARAWGEDSGEISYNRWTDEWDASAFHHVVYSGSNLVGAVRFTIHQQCAGMPDFEVFEHMVSELPLPVAHCARLVVDPDFRRRGVGQTLDWVIANAPFNSGANSIISTTGSHERTAHRQALMIKNGWNSAGIGRAKSTLPVPDKILPQIYFRVREGVS